MGTDRLGMRRSAVATLTAALVAVGMTGCASLRTPGETPGGLPEPTQTLVHGQSSGGPPPFVVRHGDSELRLAPTSWCWQSSCADGHDPDPPSVGSPGEVLVFVPVEEFTQLYVSQRSSDDYCTARTIVNEPVELGDGWWSLTAAGPAEDWIVDVFASGDGVGDMIASFVWATTDDLPLPPPTASLTLIVDHDGAPDSYGLELLVNGLTQTPETATASITVTADNGEALTIEAAPAEGCVGEGALFFDGPDGPARQAAGLGDFPFTYDVTLTLDGVPYEASAVYPDDAPSQEIAVPLEFAPALP